MTSEQKHKISISITNTLSKIKYYGEAIRKIKTGGGRFYEASLSCRLMGIRSAIWVDCTPDEVIYILNRKIKQEKTNLSLLEKKIK